MKKNSRTSNTRTALCFGASLLLTALGGHISPAANYQVLGWNDVGVDRLDSDYSVFSLWPPGNTMRAQVIYQGKRLTNTNNITVTYQAVADPGWLDQFHVAGQDRILAICAAAVWHQPGGGHGLERLCHARHDQARAMTFNTTNGLVQRRGHPDDAVR